MQSPTSIKRWIFILLLTGLFQIPVAHSALIELQPGSLNATTGDSISLDLVISGLGNFGPDSLGAFDVSVGFDPSIFAFTSYSLGGYLGDLGLLEALDASFGDLGGSINLAEVSLLSAASLDALQPGAFTLATLNFDVINLAVGAVSQLSLLSGAVLADGNGDALEARIGAAASVEGVASTVPLSGTLSLLLAALFGLFMLRSHYSLHPRIEAHNK